MLLSEREGAGDRLRIPVMDMGIFHLTFSVLKTLLDALSHLRVKNSTSVCEIATIIPFYR